MADDGLDALLRVLEQPVRPERAFADQLYAQLVVEAGLRERPRRPWLERLALAPGSLAGAGRLAWIVLLVALLAALVAGLSLVGSLRPDELVARSQAVFRSPPPFAMSTRAQDGGEARYLFDGTTLRIEGMKGPLFGDLPEGSFVLRSAERSATYNAGSREWSAGEGDPNSVQFRLPNWLATVRTAPGSAPPLVSCDDWRLGDEARVADRSARIAQCGTDLYWIDRETDFLLKRASAGSPVAEVVALEINPALPAELFAFRPPPGAIETAEVVPPLRPQSSVLTVGAAAPTWTGRLLEGGMFSTDELRGRPAAVFIWCACAWGPQPEFFIHEAKSRPGAMELVLVSIDREGTTRGLVDWLGVTTKVVQDSQSELLQAWGLSSFPALVLFRADGTVADIQPASFDAQKLRQILDAVQAGEQPPEPRPFPSPAPPSQLSALMVGQPAPELRGPRLGGGELSTRDLVGRPTVVLHWLPRDAGGPPQDDAPGAEALLAEMRRRGSALNVLLVAHGEPTPGAVGRYLAEQGSDAPVIFDWDGALKGRWGVIYLPTLVLLDAEGRVAGVYGSDAVTNPDALLDAFEAGEPLPSPSN